MRNIIRQTMAAGTLPVILLAAVIQGWALYGLHQSIKHSFWPATDSSWLAALYSLALIVPLTTQLLSQYVRSKVLWGLLTLIAVAYFYFGWHYGSAIYDGPTEKFVDSGDFAATAFIMGLLWLLFLPFVQLRLTTGSWAAQYPLLFTTAWRNKLMLAEAALFTGLFWLLLFLWRTLFHMLGIDYFQELFEEPIFVYPVTTLAFGIALHLIGSVERLTTAILEQLLNVLKWLAIIAGFILTIFTIALVFKLPGLVFLGQKAIGAAWLLWLVAVIVLLVNAAYRDGSVERPYPAWIAFALRCVIPLTIIVSSTALYALSVRARHYGITVERVWAFVVAGTALLYSIGYSVAALRKGSWLEGVGRVNVMVAAVLIATLAVALTPLLSPYRLAANSQYRVALATPVLEDAKRYFSSFNYLRFDAGQYGMRRLRELSELKDHPNAQRIHAAAAAALKSENRWQPMSVDAEEVLSKMKIYPPDHPLDAKLRAKLADEIGKLWKGYALVQNSTPIAAGIFIGLRDDKTEQFVLLQKYGGSVFQQLGDDWELQGSVTRIDGERRKWRSFLDALDEGKVGTSLPGWKLLDVGSSQFRVDLNRGTTRSTVFEADD